MEPQEYRILSPEEIIQEGDELNVCKGWIKVRGLIGQYAHNHPGALFRRPIPVSKSETTPATVEAQYNCPPRCSLCGRLHYITVRCDVHAEAYPEPVPTVKESLTTDPDESSDNSRSFQEIKILSEEVEMWKKLCRENDADLVAMKLRAEKADEKLDLFVDEFKRIIALTKTSVDWHNASEVEGICERAIGDIKQLVPLIEQRDKAERERDEAREKLQTAELLWKQSQDGLIEAAQERDTLRAERDTLQKHRDEAEGLLFDKDQENARLREAIRDMLIKAHESCDEETEMELERIAALAKG